MKGSGWKTEWASKPLEWIVPSTISGGLGKKKIGGYLEAFLMSVLAGKWIGNAACGLNRISAGPTRRGSYCNCELMCYFALFDIKKWGNLTPRSKEELYFEAPRWWLRRKCIIHHTSQREVVWNWFLLSLDYFELTVFLFINLKFDSFRVYMVNILGV